MDRPVWDVVVKDASGTTFKDKLAFSCFPVMFKTLCEFYTVLYFCQD